MKKIIFLLLITCISIPALGRDTTHLFDVQEALAANDARGRLGNEVKFYFGDQPHSAIERVVSQDIVANRKTNAFGKSDLNACQWVFLSAMLALRDAALQRGANAVVNIESFYDKNPFSDRERYECHAGNVVAGVVLKGDLVVLK